MNRSTNLKRSVVVTIAALAALSSAQSMGGQQSAEASQGKRVDNARKEARALAAQVERVPVLKYEMPSSVTVGDAAAMLAAERPEGVPQAQETLSESVVGALFESGRAELLPETRASLDALAGRLRGKEQLRLSVDGHADMQSLAPATRVAFGDNQGLSEARALVVAQYLREALGLPAEAVSVTGYGDLRPVASNINEEGRAQNRRVEVSAWYVQRVAAPPAPAASGPCDAIGSVDLPFRITVDGEPLVSSEGANEADRQRCVDVALAAADIQVKYDDLAANPALNVWSERDAALQGQTVRFAGWANYVAWIRKAEVRIFRHEVRPSGTPLAVVPLTWGESAEWTVPVGSTDGYRYVLRVYDEQGRFDETAEKTLTVVAYQRELDDLQSEVREARVGWGENALSLRNIPVRGGTITVSGRNVAPGSTVRALGMNVPLGDNGRFVERQILPAGPHGVEVQLTGAGGAVAKFRRNVSIPTDDWFYVAIADLTVGRNVLNHRDNAELITGDDRSYRNETYIDGRGAFYLKGRIKGEWLLTAAADTREQPLEHLFTNFTSKDPRYLLRNIDPDAYYPVYGDDSTTVDDAPTQGKFYVRLERGDSQVMWGNFQTAWTGSELVQYSRGLYGARGRFVSEESTGFGERRTRAEVFAADPGTLGAQQEFRGTGGSLYYLRNQDITQGSERIWVEMRDRDSGLVIERRQLTPALDYEINYLQGRVMLREPLPSSGSGSGKVYTSAINGNPLYLVATYEFVPGMEQVDNLTAGLRVTHWVNDYFRLGLTGFRQGEDAMRQSLGGLDLLFRAAPGTTFEVEMARSTGAGSLTTVSADGGFGVDTLASSGGNANAVRVEATVDLAEVTDSTRGEVAAYWQKKDAGYSGPGQIAIAGEEATQYGARASVELSERDELSVKADQMRGEVQERRNVEIGWDHQLDDEWALGIGLRNDTRETRTAGVIVSERLAEEGERTDAIVRLGFRPLKDDGNEGERDDWDVYGFVQGTLAKSGERRDNNRVGVGGGLQLNDRARLKAEASGGNGGAGGLLGIDYRVSDRSNAYLNYVLETEGTDYAWRGRNGSLVTGADFRVSEQVRVFGENRVTHGAGPQGLVQAFGVDLAPNDRWTYGLKLEFGRIEEPLSEDVRRRAVGMSVAYSHDRIRYAGALEFRQDRSATGTGRTWLTRNTLGYQMDPAWRLIGKFNASQSSGSRGSFWDGDFREVVIGAAYRPIDNDRWNTLVKYTNFQNVPSSGQLSASGRDADYSQRSHVFSIDTIWDAFPTFSLGFKYGVRVGEIRYTNPDSQWFRSRADLLVLRGDWHFVREWDAVVEWRKLRAREAKDARAGALLAVYRHVGKNVKLGLGYNFTTYSDDLTDLSYRSKGWFLNVVATY